MAQIRSFKGIHYNPSNTHDFAALIAPPYDVLDEAQKRALQAKDRHNVVTIDLPFTPPKSVGPDAVYHQADTTLRAWIDGGVLKQDTRPGLYPYTQSYQHGGRTFHRRGLIALVKLSPFGQGVVVPHEKTHKGPIEDRMKLMQATGVQLSPIFGLFHDPSNEVTSLLYKQVTKPMLSGTLDGVQNDLWTIHDAQTENAVIDAMKNKPIYIADGHHRYTTALAYQQWLTEQNGGSLSADHPANWCMFVLVGMQDPGLLILPTHRIIGGLKSFNIEKLKQVVADVFDVVPAAQTPDQMNELAHDLLNQPPHTFGLYDGITRRSWLLKAKVADPLARLQPDHSESWRNLDVAILQHYLLEQVIAKTFAPGGEPTKNYTADAQQVPSMADGAEYQIGLLLKPTPLAALQELARYNEVMPQKSTYFYPKLATGMMMHSLRPPV